MFRAISHNKPSIKSISQTLTQNPIFSIPNLHSQQHNHKHTNTGGDSVLKPKLDEALNLANSLEEQRDGFYDSDFSKKELPPHLVVQNPASRITRADTYFGPGTVDTIKCHLNAEDSRGGVDAVFVNANLTGIQQRNLEILTLDQEL
ncbi:GTP-binding protein At3g49725, chloroplastic-like [Rutidosis leptorrhynchoides]|uniref:GTP-binding protein At3g49725, chloroplastic-like n=1 Tax=Rutidosis leptorrhynchoides TaxID=125765 RepID=UPI003A9A1A27